MVNPRNFIYHSGYPIDKVIGIKSGSFTATGATSGTASLAHGISFKPLAIGQWSLISNFSSVYEPDNNPAGDDPNTPNLSFRTNSTTIFVDWTNPGVTTTVYWRAFFLIPSDLNPAIAATVADSSNEFMFNTGFNYTKLAYEGIATTSPTTVTHSLGFRPQVIHWKERTSTGDIRQDQRQTFISPMDTNMTRAEVDNTSVVFTFDASFGKVHYRIYADE